MPYIVTYNLNREQESFWILESLDKLPKELADQIDYMENEFGHYYENIEDFQITGIYEITNTIQLRDSSKIKVDRRSEFTQQMKDIFAKAQIELNNIHNQADLERKERDRKLEEKQFKILKAKLGK